MSRTKRIEQKIDKSYRVLGVLSLGVLGITSYQHLTWGSTAFLILATGGLGICLSIVQHLAGKENGLTRQLCHTEGKSNCDEVLSKGKLWKNITLADVGAVYFGTQLIYIWISAVWQTVNIAMCWLIIPVILAEALTVALLGYQGFILRKWCRLCLLITGILWIQFAILAAFYVQNHYKLITIYRQDIAVSSLFLLVTCICLTSYWFVFKQWYLAKEQNKRMRDLLINWKKNSTLFWTFIEEEEGVLGTDYWENEVILGNRQAQIQLICVMSPFCKACAAEFPAVDQLLKAYGKHMGVCIRFNIREGVVPDPKTNAVREILRGYIHYTSEEDRRALLKDWFEFRNLKRWSTKWPTKEVSIDKTLLSHHVQWCSQNRIIATPSYVLNGKKVSDLYKIYDLRTHIRSRIKPRSQSKIVSA